MSAATGFVSVDAAGEFVRWNACFIDASWAMRSDLRVRQIVRCSDDAVMRFRRAKKKAHRMEEAVPA